jgi:hypothetical protein
VAVSKAAVNKVAKVASKAVRRAASKVIVSQSSGRAKARA